MIYGLHAERGVAPGKSTIGRFRISKARHMSVASNNTLLGLDRTDLLALVEKTGEPAYRAQQLADAIYGKRVKSIDEISTLPAQMRQNLIAEGFSIGVPKSTNGSYRKTERSVI